MGFLIFALKRYSENAALRSAHYNSLATLASRLLGFAGLLTRAIDERWRQRRKAEALPQTELVEQHVHEAPQYKSASGKVVFRNLEAELDEADDDLDLSVVAPKRAPGRPTAVSSFDLDEELC